MITPRFAVGDLANHAYWPIVVRIEQVMPADTYVDGEPRQTYYCSRVTGLRAGYDVLGEAKDIFNESQLEPAEASDGGMLF